MLATLLQTSDHLLGSRGPTTGAARSTCPHASARRIAPHATAGGHRWFGRTKRHLKRPSGRRSRSQTTSPKSCRHPARRFHACCYHAPPPSHRGQFCVALVRRMARRRVRGCYMARDTHGPRQARRRQYLAPDLRHRNSFTCVGHVPALASSTTLYTSTSTLLRTVGLSNERLPGTFTTITLSIASA